MLGLLRNFQWATTAVLFLGVVAAGQLPADASPILAASEESIVNIISWMALAILCLAVRTAMASKLVVAHKLIYALLAISLGFTAAFIASYTLQTRLRLDPRLSKAKRPCIDYSETAGFASQILFIIGIFFSKISTCAVLMALAPTKKHRLPTLAVEVTILLWTVTSLCSVIKDQAKLPKGISSTSELSFQKTAFWYGYAKIDILTDVAIILSPISLVRKLRLPLQKKTVICLAFCFRGLVIALALCRIAAMKMVFQEGSDAKSRIWGPALATALQLLFAVLGACMPHLRPFKENVQAGCAIIANEESPGDLKQVIQDDSSGRLSRSNAVELLKSDTLKSRGNSPMP